MRTSRFRDEQIVGILQEHAAGERTGALCRRHGISEQTLYRGKRKYDGLEGHERKRLKALQEENARRKRLVAEQARDNQALKELLRNTWCGPPRGGQRCSMRRSSARCQSGGRASW
jgi:putative transposase